ncbi:MAG: hypothetical protein R6V54_15300 [Desulfobacteraceae bacterium]
MEMAQGRVMEQMVDFQKSAFDTTYDSMATLQEQSRKMVDLTMDQTPWFPANGKKIVAQWSDLVQKNRNDLKTLMDNNFCRVRDCFFQEETAKASPSADSAKETAAPKTTGAKQPDTAKADKASKTDAGTKKK